MTFPAPSDVARLMSDFVTIYNVTSSQDDEGEEVVTLGSAVLTDVSAQFSPLGGRTEVRNANGDFVLADAQLYVLGDWAIDETMVADTRGELFDIVGVERWSDGAITGLHLQRRSP